MPVYKLNETSMCLIISNQMLFCSTVQILENVAIEADLNKGRRYFEGSVKFMKTLQEVLDMLIDTVSV